MNRIPLCLTIVAALTVGCATDDPHVDREGAAHQVLGEHLRAMAEGDWEHVYELTADEARPTNRRRWLQRRQDRDDGFLHRCVGSTTGRPAVDLETLESDTEELLVQATVWVEPDRGTTCRWRLIEEPDGWRVGNHIDRAEATRDR
ncbi:hypothetical protein [Nitriliruptor alkaliphilus]|uniref:hypothetical protein n=1 Tax=Nitriliruptor alkaliphilus TaxID=427918 RepID=UPI000697F816|nr:hypothetical protein [Nitriliruptor alkaliphilus]